ncbi:sortase domain-bontaining protein [Streptomyces fodineus]|uniref:sortase domain-containing protein n=1 Tax=Streptomyces fodineus TaxID=1904616 RepID=UPI001D038C43|nr:sortase [Streptomyces fodineus]
MRVLGVALSILGALLLGFVLDVGPLGDLRHVRDRQVDYAALRSTLANGVAPVGGPVGPGTPVALLDIPALHLREVVREGTTAEDLARGPGHRRDTVLPGQAGVSVVMGRQTTFGGPFLHLRELRPGDAFTVTGQGKRTYRVLGLRRAGDPQPPALTAGHGRLTLITADGTPFMPRGILRVDADLVSRAQATPAPGVTPGRPARGGDADGRPALGLAAAGAVGPGAPARGGGRRLDPRPLGPPADLGGRRAPARRAGPHGRRPGGTAPAELDVTPDAWM